VLRYWEQEFPQLNPVKRRGNRRYYQRQDVLMIRQIRACCTIKGSPSAARACGCPVMKPKTTPVQATDSPDDR
jgi:hypothetical protein